jgi:hydroxymethylpyrimidine pyrophosphatase-like HAD family hydrolase
VTNANVNGRNPIAGARSPFLPEPESRGPTPDSIRLIASDIDGTLLNPQFQISDDDLTALRRAHAAGIEVVLVTGRRHTFALPIAQQLGFDLWLISSNGAVTRSLAGETFPSRPDAARDVPRTLRLYASFPRQHRSYL